MSYSRRKFINTSLLAGTGILSPVLLNSCITQHDSSKEILADYIGEQEIFLSYRQVFRKLKKIKFSKGSFETSLNNESSLVFLDTRSENKSTYIVMLMEQGKDIFTSFPIGKNLLEYAMISEFMEKYGRILGILNPLAYYPSFETLQNIISKQSISINAVRISCHPSDLSRDFSVGGTSQAAQPLQRIVSWLSGLFPVSIMTEEAETGYLKEIQVNYMDFETNIIFDRKQYGWNMELRGVDPSHASFIAFADHTGLLTVNDELKSGLSGDPAVMDKAIISNLEDFLNAVRERSMPRVNFLDGLASIILNTAVEKSVQTGSVVYL